MMTSCENDLILGLSNKTDKTKNTANSGSCSKLLVLHGFGGVSEFKQVLWTALVSGVALVKCQLVCVCTACFRFVLYI